MEHRICRLKEQLPFGTTIIWCSRYPQRHCALDTNQDHGSDFNGESLVPVHLAPALEVFIRAMDIPPPLESIPLANERIDDIDFDGRVVLDVLNVSPAYDRGETEGQVKDRWRRYWRKLWEDVEK